MECRLRQLNGDLSAAIQELKNEHSKELQAAQTISQDAKELPAPLLELNRSLELVNELRLILDSPLYTIIDGIFGNLSSQTSNFRPPSSLIWRFADDKFSLQLSRLVKHLLR
jgi:hypothetical protein